MRVVFHIVLFSIFLQGSFLLGQVVVSPPIGTSITTSSGSPYAFGYPGGQTYTNSNSSWPAFNTNCYVFAINDMLYDVQNANNPGPTGGPCVSMSDVSYNTLQSNLPTGKIVYTGTTTYRYKDLSNVFVTNTTIPFRVTVQFSVPVTYYPNNTFVIPVTGNFNYNVLYECFSPANAQYSSGVAGVWTPSKTLYDNLLTDPANSFCMIFPNGDYTLHTVTANTASSSSLCQGSTLNLVGGGTGNNLTFSWTGPNSFSSTLPSPTISNVSSVNSGVYSLTATSDIGCPNTITTTVNVQQPPVSHATGTSTICVSTPFIMSGASSSNGTIVWTHNGSGSISNATSLTPTYTPAPSDAGNTVVLTMTVNSNNSCAPSSAQSQYNLIVQGNPKAVDMHTDSICPGTSFTITTATAQNGLISWIHNGSGTLTNGNTATPTYTPSAGDVGNTVVLTLTVTSNNVCAPGLAQSFHVLYVSPLPYAVAGGSTSLCENSSIIVPGAIANYGTISWSHNGTGSITNINSLTPTYTSALGDVGNIVTLTMTVTSTVCPPASTTADFSINVVGLPTAIVSDTVTICAGSSVNVSGASFTNGTYSWTHNGAGMLSNTSTLTPSYQSSALDAGHTVLVKLNVASNNGCSPATANAYFVVHVDKLPSAIVPVTAIICGALPYTVSGTSYSDGTPSWTTTGAGTLTNINTGAPTYTPVPSEYGQNINLTMNVTSNNTCAPYITSQTITVTVQHPPVAVAGGVTTACESGVANVTGATATYGTINWTHTGTGTLTNPTTLGPVYHPTAADIGTPITLTLTVTSNNSCAPMTASDTYTINIDPLPTVSAGFTDTICSNNAFLVSGVTSNYGTINWTTNGVGNLTDITTLTPTYTPLPSEAGSTVVLTIEVMSNNTCMPTTVTDTYTLTIDPPPSLTIPITQDTICPNSIYLVQNVSSSNGSVLWTHNGTGTLTGATTDNPVYIAGAGDPGNFVVLTCVVSSNNGCAPQAVTQTINLFVESNVNLPFIALDNITNISCNGSLSGSISITVTGGAPPYSYLWSNSSTQQDLINVAAGTYYIDLTDDHGCFVTDTFIISQPTPIVVASTVIPIDCINGTLGTIEVSASGGNGPYTYFWPEFNSTADSITGIPSGPHILVVTDASGCTHTDTIDLAKIGDLVVTATPSQSYVNIGTEVPLTATGTSFYTWTSGEYLSCVTCSNPVSTPLSSITYVVTGYNADGCSGRDTVVIDIFVDCEGIAFPNIFSPDGRGPEVNNTFGVIGTIPCVDEYMLLVFNRWGEQVFESQDPTVKWDGNFHGKPQNSGVYFFRSDMKLIDGTEVKKSGNITLVR